MSQAPGLTGQRLGPVEVQARLGAGAMGVVYEARHDEHGTICVKVLSLRNMGLDTEFVKRFHREAEAGNRIDHPHVVRGYGMVEAGGYQLLMQELVTGGDLDQALQRYGGPMPVSEALRLTREIALGLEAAHAAGLVHRDLKPGNVLLDAEGRAKVADLGLVLQVDGEPLHGQTVLTQKDTALGTPFYMAPEQWRSAHHVDARADLYSLGIMLHQMCAAKRPIPGKTVAALMKAHLTDAPVPLRSHNPAMPASLEQLVLRMLAKDPAGRPANARAVVEAIDEIASDLGVLDAVRRSMSQVWTTVDAGPGTSAPNREAGHASDPHDVPVSAAGPQKPSAAAPPAPSSPEALLDRVIGGKFHVRSILGTGGMGVVYKAHHTLLEEDYAVKVLQPHLAADPEFRRRFLREAKAMQAFVHENAVTLREFGEHEGWLYMALDFAPGRTLTDVMRAAGPFSEERALGVARQVLGCLQKAHDAGLVHRDIKPQNILVETMPDGSDRCRVLDFGIAKMIEAAAAAAGVDGTLTGKGVSIGTPHYMSPEQEAGDAVDARTDIYSFACVLYELVTGRRPIDAETRQKLRYKIQFEQPPPLLEASGGRVSESFARAVMQGLAKDRTVRPGSAVDFIAMLEGWAEASDPGAPPAPPASMFETGPTAVLGGGSGPARATGAGAGTAAGATAGATGALGASGTGTGMVGRGVGSATDPGSAGAVVDHAARTMAVTGASPIQPVTGVGRGHSTMAPAETPPRRGRRGLVIVAAMLLVGAVGSGVYLGLDRLGPGAAGGADVDAPVVALTEPADGLVTAEAEVTIAGTLQDASAPEFVVVRSPRAPQQTDLPLGDLEWRGNGWPATVRDGRFEVTVPLQEGANRFELLVRDRAGNETEATRVVLVDRDAPEVSIEGAGDGGAITVGGDTVTVRGRVQDANPARVLVGGEEVALAPDGTFRAERRLAGEGEQEIEIVCEDRAGNRTARTVAVARDATAPTVQLFGGREGGRIVTRESRIVISGTAKDDRGGPVTVTVGGEAASVGADGAFRVERAVTTDGEERVEIVATDAAGNATRRSVTVVRDATAPAVTVEMPTDGAFVRGANVLVRGKVADPSGVSGVDVDGRKVALGAEGGFEATVELTEDGERTIEVVAIDGSGNRTTQKVTVTRDSVAPELLVGKPGLESAEPSVLTRDPKQDVSIIVTDANPPADVTFGGKRVALTDGRATVPLPPSADGAIEVVCVDRAGNKTERTLKVVVDTTPPALRVAEPADGALITDGRVIVRGTVADDNPPVVLTVAGTKVEPRGQAFSAVVRAPQTGEMRVEIVATDRAGNQSRVVRTVRADAAAPVITFDPSLPKETPERDLELAGTVSEAGCKVTVGGKAAKVDGKSFRAGVSLEPGDNAIEVVATDAAGNTGRATARVRFAMKIAAWSQVAEVKADRFLVKSVAFHPSELLVASTGVGNVTVWTVPDLKEVKKLEGHSGHVNAVAWSPDGAYLVSGSDDKTAKIWRVKDWRLVATLEAHADEVTDVAYSPDGRFIVTVGRDDVGFIWSSPSGGEEGKFGPHAGDMTGVVFSADGGTILTQSDDNTIRAWQAGDGRALWAFGLPYPKALATSGNTLATAWGDKELRLYALDTRALLAQVAGHDRAIRAMAFAPDGARLVTGGEDRVVRVFTVPEGKVAKTLRGHDSDILAVAWSKDGRWIASAGQDKTLRIWAVGP